MKYVKYPRTYHVPWSEGATNDDKINNNMSFFCGKTVVITEKMDGENFTGYSDGYCHARSINSSNHISRDWVRSFWKSISYNLPCGWRVCGENLYAKHSIAYYNLRSYLYGFSIWDENNFCLSWQETIEWFSLLFITPVNVWYVGEYDEKLIKDIKLEDNCEGYVIRLANGFHYDDFEKSVAKFVRKNHVTSDDHWIHQKIVPNKLI
jgi:hypothetical protein